MLTGRRSAGRLLGRWHGVSTVVALLGCRPSHAVRTNPTAQATSARACPASLLPLAPPGAARWLWVRPRALFDDPQAGPLLAGLLRDTGERALLDDTERNGVDLRTVERALFVDPGDGALLLAAGAFDAQRIIGLQWDRMLPPRRRSDAGHGAWRIEGMLGGRRVSVAADGACGLYARAEGNTRAADRVLADGRTRPRGDDPMEPLRWHVNGAPASVTDAAGAAITASLRWFELRATPTPEGLRTDVVLDGPLPADTPARVARFLETVVASPLGASVGADEWLAPGSVTWERRDGQWWGRATLPWRGLRALADLGRGRIDVRDRPSF